METLEIPGDWKQIKDQLLQRWTWLSEEDLHFAEGREALFDRLVRITGETREAVEQAFNEATSRSVLR